MNGVNPADLASLSDAIARSRYSAPSSFASDAEAAFAWFIAKGWRLRVITPASASLREVAAQALFQHKWPLLCESEGAKPRRHEYEEVDAVLAAMPRLSAEARDTIKLCLIAARGNAESSIWTIGAIPRIEAARAELERLP